MAFLADVVFPLRLAASGTVGDSGKAVDIVGYSIKSGSTAGNIYILNGTSLSAPLLWADQARATSAEQTISIPFRTRCPLGCYVSFDNNVTACTIFYQQVMGQ